MEYQKGEAKLEIGDARTKHIPATVSETSSIIMPLPGYTKEDGRTLPKMSIAYKEADETDFWLNLLHDNGYINETQFESLSNDLTRILKILTSIVKTMRQKVGKE